MKSFISVVALAAFASTGSARSPFGRAFCPAKPETKLDFDATKYLGDWYQVYGIPNYFQPSGSHCIRATYGDLGDGTISVHNVVTYPDNEYGEICGDAYCPDPEFPGELLVQFPSSPAGAYWVLDTDYENWSAVYACQDILGIVKIEYGWVLSRTPEMSQEMLDQVLAVFSDKGISLDQFEPINNPADCVYDVSPSCGDEFP